MRHESLEYRFIGMVTHTESRSMNWVGDTASQFDCYLRFHPKMPIQNSGCSKQP